MTPEERELADRYEQEQSETVPLADLPFIERLRAQLVAGDDIHSLPAPEPLIDGVLDRGATALLYGRAGHCKSFVALDWALSAATSSSWFGRAVEPVPVLYVVGEGFAGLAKRVAAWQQARQTWTTGTLHFLPVGVNLSHPGQTEDLATVALELGAGFIILDTLARCMVGADENSARDMGQVVAHIDKLRDLTKATVLGVHHTGKSQQAGLRGSSAIEAGVDTAILCELASDIVTVTDPRQKHRASGTLTERFELTEVDTPQGPSCVLSFPSRTARDGLSDRDRRVLQTLDDVDPGTGVPATTWLKSLSGDLGESTFYRARKSLLEDSYCHNVGSEGRPLYSLSTKGQSELHCHAVTSLPPTPATVTPLTSTTSPPLRGDSGESGREGAIDSFIAELDGEPVP